MMNTTQQWHEENHRYLAAALARVRTTLQTHMARVQGEGIAVLGPPASLEVDEPPPALVTLCRIFDLSPFERDTLLLCAGMELEGGWAALCAAAQGDSLRPYPTFSLALAALPDAHWSALTPEAPLRRARLIVLSASNSLTFSQLRIDERILHYLTGINQGDDRLAGLVESLPPAGELVPSHRALAERVCAIWASPRGIQPVVQLCGGMRQGNRAVASAACAALGLKLGAILAESLPSNQADIEPLLRLWGREAALTGSALLLDCYDSDMTDAVRANIITHFINRAPGILFVSGRERQRGLLRPMVTLEVQKPTTCEQHTLWHVALGKALHPLHGEIEALTAQFDVGAETIRAAVTEAVSQAALDAEKGSFVHALWDACRVQARPRLDDLAQRIESCADWNDLVLPEAQRLILQTISAHVRRRATVYEAWGFAGKGARGLGISALFAGASGTGKTMAAEVLAGELNLDLYRIDLSAVVSKYIGETEKNLRRVFDAAEEGGAVLLFDEADALFGKRSEVKDSHDRYANIEVSYLLQRMECYRGLAILTTNLKSALDTAFLRRLRFVVQFPFPDAAQRAEIWRRIFPANTPTEGLDIHKLARLNMAGGNIRNIALNAAFLAADAGEPVQMVHILRAAQAESAKLEKTLTDTEVAGWV